MYSLGDCKIAMKELLDKGGDIKIIQRKLVPGRTYDTDYMMKTIIEMKRKIYNDRQKKKREWKCLSGK